MDEVAITGGRSAISTIPRAGGNDLGATLHQSSFPASGRCADKGPWRLWLEHADAIAEPTNLDEIADRGEPVF